MQTKRVISILFVVLLLLSIVMFTTSCDTFLGYEGVVYERLDVPDDYIGEIYISEYTGGEGYENIPSLEGYNLQPIESANISLYYQKRGSDEYIQDDFLTSLSDNNGEFRATSAVYGGKYWKIVVEKDGYYTMEKYFLFGEAVSFYFTVILVRKP